MKNVISLVTGDWSDDGHMRRDTAVIRCNLSAVEIEKAYKKGVNKIGFDLTESVACDCEDNLLSEKDLIKLIDSGYSEFEGETDEGWNIYHDDFVSIYLHFVKIGNDKFVYEQSHNRSNINIGGYGLYL